VTIKLDTVSPTITGARSPAANAAGWNKTPVTVSFSCTDAGAGLASCASSSVVGTEGLGQSVSGTAVDVAGNAATAVVGGINVDVTPPVVTASVSRAPDMNGWYNHPFGVSWSGTDTLSEIDACLTPVSPYAGPDTGAGQLIGTCVDRAGNTASAPVAFKYDATAPSIAIAQPADGATFALNQAAPAESYTCSDAGGVASCVGSVPSGAPISTATPGLHSLTVNALDSAGNPATLTHHYTVRYAFDGFLSPLNNLPTTNRGPAGRTYPVKWILRDGTGAYISDPAAISGVTLVPGSCSGATAEVAGEDTAVQVSGLRFDSATGIWHFNWQTQKSQVGCWSLQVRLADGSVHAIAFDLR